MRIWESRVFVFHERLKSLEQGTTTFVELRFYPDLFKVPFFAERLIRLSEME